MARLYRLTPLQPLVLRKPSDNTALAHGPAVGAESMSQPFPSSLSGSLANYARLRGLCSPSSCGPSGFDNIKACLENLLGQGYHVYTGIMVDDDLNVWVPTARGYVMLEKLPCYLALQDLKPLDKDTTQELLRRITQQPRTSSRIGVALKPAMKTTRPGMLYTLQETFPPTNLNHAVIVKGNTSQLPPVIPAEVGGKHRVSILEQAGETNTQQKLVHGERGCTRWVLYLTSPALLEKTPWLKGEPVQISGTGKLVELARQLLAAASHANDYKIIHVYVPKTSPGLEVIAPGWCTPEKRPRKPYLHIPPGTWIEIEADSSSIEKIVEKGLGLHTEIGWGTVVATC